METLDAERYPTHGPVGKNKDHFFNQSRNDSAFESLLGSSSDRSLLQDSSLSSITSFDSKDGSVVTEDGEDVFSDETITYSEDESQSQIMASPKKLVESKPIQTFYSWEDYHRSDTSKTGLIFLWMYLKKIPGREADAEATLAKYYGYDVESKVEQTKVEHKSVEQQKVTTPLRQTEPDKTGYKSDGFTTDDEPNELSRLYERKSRKKPKKKLTPVEGGDTKVTAPASFENEITTDKMALVAKLDLPSEIKSMSIYAKRDETRPIQMMLETEKSNWSVLVKPDGDNSMVQIHDQIDSTESGYKLTNDDSNDLNKLTINKNAWAQNEHFKKAKTIQIFTDANWSVGYNVTYDEADNLVGYLPLTAREIKFRLDGHIWSTLNCMKIKTNSGWNANNLIQ